MVTEDNAEPFMSMVQGYLTLNAFKVKRATPRFKCLGDENADKVGEECCELPRPRWFHVIALKWGKGGEGEGEEEAQGQGLHPSTIRASRFLFTGF